MKYTKEELKKRWDIINYDKGRFLFLSQNHFLFPSDYKIAVDSDCVFIYFESEEHLPEKDRTFLSFDEYNGYVLLVTLLQAINIKADLA